MKKLDSKGFGIVEGLLILVILGLIGGVGYYVYSANKDVSNDNAGNSQAVKPPADESVVEGTENWKTETNEEFGFSYKYPDNNNCEIFYIMTEKDSQEYQDGQRIGNSGVHCTPENARMPQTPFEMSVTAIDPNINDDRYGEDLMMGNDFYKLTSNERIEKNGRKGVKWVYSPDDENASDQIIYYEFISGDYSYSITINGTRDRLPGVKGTELGEKIFATFQFTD